MPDSSSTIKVFDFKPRALLDNLKESLALQSNWKQYRKERSLTKYRNADFRLGVGTEPLTGQVNQITIESASTDKPEIDLALELLIHVMSKISPDIQDRIGFITQLLSRTNDGPDIAESVVNQISYSTRLVKGVGIVATIHPV